MNLDDDEETLAIETPLLSNPVAIVAAFFLQRETERLSLGNEMVKG